MIGFHKTGTSSYGKALQRLGYKVCGSLKEAYDYESSGLKFNEYLIEKAKPLFEKYDALSITDLKKYASDLSLDLNQFNECLNSGKYEESVQNDVNDAKGVGVSGTPTFFIGNEEIRYEKIVGAQSFSKFQEIIESKISV